ncbi:MAG: hypothetical protein GY725_24895 [bacterium]|nr:hypothetical protein [bacterium]
MADNAFDQVIDQASVTVSDTSNSVVLTYVGAVIPADFDGDGFVTFADLLEPLEAWGDCPRNLPCPEDLNHDRVVYFSDLLILLSQWS